MFRTLSRRGLRMARLCAGLLIMTAAHAESHRVLVQTDAGDFVIEVDLARAPVTAANFLRYADAGHYHGGSFYRTVTYESDNGDPKIEVIQGGLGNGATAPLPPIEHESTDLTGLTHLDGTVSMARGAAGTAASEFFICIGDQPGLDAGAARNADRLGFAAFGQVVEGMDVVRRIHQQPADAPTDVAYVAAMGRLWAPNPERGVYKTTDAGRTWDLVLAPQ